MTITTLKPETAAQVTDAVRWALSAGEPLEILGSGSRSSKIKIAPEIFRRIPNATIVPDLAH